MGPTVGIVSPHGCPTFAKDDELGSRLERRDEPCAFHLAIAFARAHNRN
jgi:hypothetical protein